MNNNNQQQQQSSSKVKYIFAFRCKSCNAILNHNGSNMHKEMTIDGQKYLIEQDLCSVCISAARDYAYSPEYVLGHLSETSNLDFSIISDDL